MFQPNSRRGNRPDSRPSTTSARSNEPKSVPTPSGVPRYLGGLGPAGGVGVPRYLGGQGPVVQHGPEAGKKNTETGIPLYLRQAARSTPASQLKAPVPQVLAPTRLAGGEAGDAQQGQASLQALRIDDGPGAQRFLAATNAHAATRGSQILMQPGGSEGARGKARLAHEVAHVLQQQAMNLPSATPERAEADADAFSHAVMSGAPAAVTVSTPIRWAYEKKTISPGDTVMGITLHDRTALVEMRGADGNYTLQFSVSHNLPPRQEPYTIIDGSKIDGLPAEQEVWFQFDVKAGGPFLKTEHFPTKVPLIVSKRQASGGGPGANEPAKSGRRADAGAPGVVPDRSKGEAPKPGTSPSSGEFRPGAPLPAQPTPSADAKMPVITITDLEQIDTLKKKGLIPAGSADQLKSKLEKQVPLSFEEAVTLLDGLNRVVERGSDEEKVTRESWLKWARFIEENKDKISGRSKTRDDGLTVNEVKDILQKHKEFVGAKDMPFRSTKDVVHDPERNKSWNNLTEGEKKLWEEYLKAYGDTADVTDPATQDLRITAAVRFSMALRMSPKHMRPGAREAAQALFNDPVFIGSTMAGITVYLALWLTPEPVFTKATAVLTTIGLISLVAFSASELKNLASAWMQLDGDSAKAMTLPELEAAAEKFGKAIGGSGLRILVALATVIAGKALPAPKPLPPPGGGGGMMSAAGGPRVIATAPVTTPAVVVRPDGAIVIIGGPLSGMAMSTGSTHGGGGSGGAPEKAAPGEAVPEAASAGEKPTASRSEEPPAKAAHVPREQPAKPAPAPSEKPAKVTEGPVKQPPQPPTLKEVLGREPTHWEEQLFKGRTPAEIKEMLNHLKGWSKRTYTSEAHNVYDHAMRKGYDALRLLRKAAAFNDRGARRVPSQGLSEKGTYRLEKKNGEYVILEGETNKIVTYGEN